MDKLPSPLIQTTSGKVGILSFVLLSFVFIIIVYSMVRVCDIRIEMQEIAEIDIPLTEAATEIETLQLELQLLIEKIQHIQHKDLIDVGLPAQLLLAKYNQVNLSLHHHLNKANLILDKALLKKLIVDDLELHQKTQKDLHALKKMQAEFSGIVISVLSDMEKTAVTNQQWIVLDTCFQKINSKTSALLNQMKLLLTDVSLQTKQHTNHFFWMLVYLGFSAFIIGIYITFYTIRFIRLRFSAIHKQLNEANNLITGAESEASVSLSSLQQDEFEQLSNHIQSVIDAYSDELSVRYKVEKDLLGRVVTDKLTGTYNRHKWDEVIELDISMVNRGISLSVIHVDLDHFKKINDQYGHNSGDEVLKQAATLMKNNIRQSDSVFRMGGEEFIILLRAANSQAAAELAENVRQDFANFEQAGIPSFTASFGVTECQPSDTVTTLIERVDAALYKAKSSGRNKVVTV
jgi:diguanylate cyclase (GGDEF)-like protein